MPGILKKKIFKASANYALVTGNSTDISAAISDPNTLKHTFYADLIFFQKISCHRPLVPSVESLLLLYISQTPAPITWARIDWQRQVSKKSWD